MEVPATVLEILKCSSCGNYLSRGPVYLQHNGAAICGRCYTPEHSATRDKYYEATAKLLQFPCKYRKLGCHETVPFTDEEEVIPHEEVCEHRQYVCPVLGPASCTWLGTRAAMLAHCREAHQDNVLESPCTLTHDITRCSVSNYLVRAFQLLFLLHTKVCLARGTIFHLIRFLGTSEEAANFIFNLDIQRNNELISKKGQVAPQGNLDFEEAMALAVHTDSLQDMLGGLDGITFTLTVKWRVSNAMEQLASRAEQLRTDIVTCAECEAEVTVFRYRKEDGWRCERCAPARRPCENQNCTHTDIDNKCEKHEVFFCQQSTSCYICKASISPGTLSSHYGSKHQDITCRAGSTWRVTFTGEWRYRLVSIPCGTAVCWYVLDGTVFNLYVYVPVPSERLREFHCEVQVINPNTKDVHTYTPDVEYDEIYDWFIEVTKHEFPTWSRNFKVMVKIHKIE